MKFYSIMTAICPFIALPSELLFTIFSFLTRLDILNQCYIRRFRSIAQDILYWEFHGNGLNIALFLRTILENKTLAYRVRRVSIIEFYHYTEWQYPRSFIVVLSLHLRRLNIPLH